MSRGAVINLVFSNNLAQQKAEFDAFNAYVAAHQPTIGGTPATGNPAATGAPPTQKTFGGYEAVSGPSNALRGAPSYSGVADESGFAPGNDRSVAAAAMRDERRRQANYDRVDRVWEQAQFSKQKQDDRQASRTNRSWDDAAFAGFLQKEREEKRFNTLTNADLVKEERLPRLTARDLVSDDVPGSSGGTGGRAGLRRFLGTEGFRTLGRYLGGFGIAYEATSALNQQNQYAIASAGATTAQDTIAAQLGYQANSPLANLPIVGPLGSAIRERFTGEQAALAGTQAATGIASQTFNINQGIIGAGFSTQAAVAGAQGDFTGQRRSAAFTAAGNIANITATNTGKVTDIDNAIAAIKANAQSRPAQAAPVSGILARLGVPILSAILQPIAPTPPTNTPAEIANINALVAQRSAINASTTALTADEISKRDAITESIGRAEAGFVTSSKGGVASLDLKYIDERKSRQIAIETPFNARIAASLPFSVEQVAATRERDAAIRNEQAEYNLQQQNAPIATESSRQGLVGNSLRSANLATYYKYGDNKFGLISRNPQSPELTAQRDVEYGQNALNFSLGQFGAAQNLQRINQSTVQQNYRNRYLFRTAGVSETISSGINQIEAANISLRGDENAALRNATVAGIKVETQSRVRGQVNPLLYNNRLEQVGAFVTQGDLGNQNYRDLREARSLGNPAEVNRALNKADQESRIPTDQLSSIISAIGDLVTAIQNN